NLNFANFRDRNRRARVSIRHKQLPNFKLAFSSSSLNRSCANNRSTFNPRDLPAWTRRHCWRRPQNQNRSLNRSNFHRCNCCKSPWPKQLQESKCRLRFFQVNRSQKNRSFSLVSKLRKCFFETNDLGIRLSRAVPQIQVVKSFVSHFLLTHNLTA